MATIRAKESDNIVYYLFEPGLVKLATYSQKVFWGVTLIVFLFFWIFIEIGGAIGGVIAAGIAAMIFNVAISSPKIDRWDKLSFADLKKEKESYYQNMIREIVAFKIDVNETIANWKMSQNHSKEDISNVIENLERLGTSESIDTAREIRDSNS